MTGTLANDDRQWAAIKLHCMGGKGPSQAEDDVR